MTGRSSSLLLVLLAATLGWAPLARGDVSGQGGELYSVEKRDIMGNHELTASVGVLPMDAFAKGLTLQGSYSYHFTQLIGWEIIGGVYSFNFDTGLEQDLKDDFGVRPTEMGELTWMVYSNAVFKPLFGKLAVINDTLLTGELFFVLGPAVGGYTAAYPFGLDFGAGLRVFVAKHFSVRFDIRDYMFLPDFEDVDNNLYLSLGLSLTFGFGDGGEGEE